METDLASIRVNMEASHTLKLDIPNITELYQF